MRRALDETDRRREKQKSYNTIHGITPKGIIKAVTEILDTGRSVAGRTRGGVREERKDWKHTYTELDVKRIARLETEMYRHARDLEFEEAARLRDEIRRLRDGVMGLTGID
jgi:excinuclease ABC subunit B